MLTLQGMTDEVYNAILAEVPEIQYLIIKSGRMATKSLVENVLMARHGLDRSDAHTFTNLNESHNDQSFRFGPVRWVAGRAEPTPEKYPELEVVR